jgi:uncharacterized repeat protein (TIGR01451 family)
MKRSGLARALLTCAIACVVALFAVTAAQATTFDVKSTADTPDASLDGTCADSAGDCTLRAAIDEANDLSSDDVIQLEAERYTITQGGTFEDFNEFGDFDVAANGTLTIKGATSDPRDTVVSGGGLDRVFQVFDGGTLSLQDLTVTDGFVNAANGGGIYVGGVPRDIVKSPQTRGAETPAALNLSNTKVVNNEASYDDYGGKGGGIASECGATITLDNSHVDRNTATKSGGGIYAGGDVTATNSTIDGNSTKKGDGGGLRSWYGNVDLTDTSVSDNRAYGAYGYSSGGGIYADGDSLTVNRGKVNDNVALDYGGGIYHDTDALLLDDTTVDDNVVQDGYSDGGGVYSDGGDVNVRNDSSVDSNSALYGDGAGLYIDYGFLTISRSSVSNNAARYDGGGVYTSGGVRIEDGTLDDNSTTKGSGGALSSGDNEDTLVITGSSLSGNSSHDGGGAVYWDGDGVSIADSSVDHNNTDDGRGGGVSSSYGKVEVTSTSVSHNHASNGGGGLYNGGDELKVTDSNINDNNSGSNGGGIKNTGAALTMVKTSVSRNVAYNDGGGIYNSPDDDSSIVNSTISGNRSDVGQHGGYGGGIYQAGGVLLRSDSQTGVITETVTEIPAGARLDLINDTIAENETGAGDGDKGGGVFSSYADVQLTNVLFANSTQSGEEDNCAGGIFTSNGHNLSTDNGLDCGLDGTADDITTDTHDPVKPKLGAIQDNGGPSETQALKDGSDAIDGGDDSVCGADPVNAVDQRGYARPFGAHCDIGAYETGYADVAVTSNVDNPDPVGSGGNVTYTITVKNLGPSPDTATGVVLHNVNPAGTTFVSSGSSQGSCSGSGPVDCALGSLAQGASATVQVTVKSGSPGDITDAATVSATTGDPDPSNNSKSQTTTVLGAQAVLGERECKPSGPRSSISRNGLQGKTSTIKLVGRTIDFRCLGQSQAGGIKKVRLAIALRVGGKCRFLKKSGGLTSARDCADRVYFSARLGVVRGGKVPWTFRKRHLDLPTGSYVAFAFGTDSQNNKESKVRRFNRKFFRIH